MAEKLDVQRTKEQLENDRRDIAQIWDEALRSYKGVVGISLQRKFNDTNEMLLFGTEAMQKFHSFRHNKGKVDKLRSLFAKNISYIQAGTAQLSAAAAPAFPPAAAIGTALTYMLGACSKVSADYDVVIAFFEDLNSFLQRITILESRLPQHKVYLNCLMDVFTSFLVMCGFATKYMELGRFKKWVINMVRGEDSELGGARSSMDTQMSRLESTTSYAILGNTEDLRMMNSELKANQDYQTQLMESQKVMLDTIIDGQESIRKDLKDIQRLMIIFGDRRRDEPPHPKSTAAQGQIKCPTANVVQGYFEKTTSPAHEHDNIKHSFISNTGSWIFQEPSWDSWFTPTGDQDQSRILTIEGAPGSGKSHLAYCIYDYLKGKADTNICVVHFYFRQHSSPDYAKFLNAIQWMVIQVAEQNPELCERINAVLEQEDNEMDIDDWSIIWSKLVEPLFSDSSHQLQIVWDGVDELNSTEKKVLSRFLERLNASDTLNIRLVCSTRLDESNDGLQLGGQSITATKEKQLFDLQVIIWHHLDNGTSLRNFRPYTKQRIASALEVHADGILYAEHALRQFNLMGRESVVLRKLEQLPKDWHGLYDDIIGELQNQTASSETLSLKYLLCWLALSRRQLTLDECCNLLKITSGDTYNLELSLQGSQLTRFLRLADHEERNESISRQISAMESLNAGNPETLFNDGDLPLVFHDRTMREYFRDGPEEQMSLRTPKRSGHHQIFLLCSKILCGDAGEVIQGLRNYAANAWAWHFSCLDVRGMEKADQLSTMDALGAIMINRNNAAAVIEDGGSDYSELLDITESSDLLLSKDMQDYAKIIMQNDLEVHPNSLIWAKVVMEDQKAAFTFLLKGHIRNWLQAGDLFSARRSFRFAKSCLSATMPHLAWKEGDANEDDNEDGDDGTDDSSSSGSSSTSSSSSVAYENEEIVHVYELFQKQPKDGKVWTGQKTPQDAHARWAVAMLLQDGQHYNTALPFAQQAVESIQDDGIKTRALDLLANIYLSTSDNDSASKTIDEALSHPCMPSKLRRTCLWTRAKVDEALERLQDAKLRYKEARMADSEEPVSATFLIVEFALHKRINDPKILVDLVKEWTALEKLAWWTRSYLDSDFQLDEFQIAAIKVGQCNVIVEAYEEIMRLLDIVNSAPPLRVWFARVHWKVLGDVDSAKALLNETLDGVSDGRTYAFTDEDPGDTSVGAILLMTDLLYEQYRTTSDPVLKASLYDEMQGLMRRRFAESVVRDRSQLVHHRVILAKMMRKMDTAERFQTQLQSAFDISYESLFDSVDWNDGFNLVYLASVISSLEGLEQEARILISAQYSELDAISDDQSNQVGNHTSESEHADKQPSKEIKKSGETEDDDDEEEPIDFCDGDCDPVRQWGPWKGETQHVCVICDAVLCELCYQKRQSSNNKSADERDIWYCGRNHKYLTVPIEGWKGIENGVMNIEGHQPVLFKDWLRDLKDSKWKMAWDRFWLAED